MSWRFESDTLIQHEKGHTLSLRGGTWGKPTDILPRYNGTITSKESVRLIREGLAFAEKHLAKATETEK